MSILVGNPFFLDAGAAGGGYEIERSLRFNSSDSAYCGRVPASAGNRTTWTLSTWLKRSKLGVLQRFFSGATATNDDDWMCLLFNGSDQLSIGGYNVFFRTSNSVYRDCSAWYHIVVTANLGSGTNSLKLRAWVNNEEVSWASTSTNPTTTGINSANNHTIGAEQAPNNGGVGGYFDGYLADIHFIDGQALDPSSFTEVSATTGQLIPKQYTGSFGTNGFWLKFSDNSATTATTLGKDYSGNGNNWTPNNLSNGVGNGRYLSTLTTNNGSFYAGQGPYFGFDGSTATFCSAATAGNAGGYMDIDVPAWNRTGSVEIYANTEVYYSVNGATAVALGSSWTNVGNAQSITTLRLTRPGTSNTPGFYAIRVNSVELIDYAADSGNDSLVDTPTSYGTDTGAGGEVRGNYCTWNPLDKGSSVTLANGNLDFSQTATLGSCRGTIGVSSGKWYWEVLSPTSGSAIGIMKASASTSDYVGGDANGWSYYANNGFKYNSNSGASYGASFGSGDVIGVAFNADAGTLTFYKNGASQGQAYSGLTSGPYFPAFGNGSTSCSANWGSRPFAYTAPSGFKALCDTNLPAPVVAKPSTAMDVKLYTGNGSTQTISGLNFSPDLVWGKYRGSAGQLISHIVYDTVRGAGQLKGINTDLTRAEGSCFDDASNHGYLSAFNSDGFTVVDGTLSANYLNKSGHAYVAWCWDAGSTTVTNTQGSITSQVRANASAGFSVVTWTGTGANATVGHGLGVAPQLLIIKRRSGANDWIVGHTSLGGWANFLYLNLTNATDTASTIFQSTAPTSTLFSLGTSTYVNGSSETYVAYCFAPVAGYSSAFSYSGNGSSDGPMVWLGFRPRFLIIKRTDAAYGWYMYDTARDTYNIAGKELLANASDAEVSDSDLDILSNGFKPRRSSLAFNASGGTFIGFAWAESPFQYARAR